MSRQPLETSNASVPFVPSTTWRIWTMMTPFVSPAESMVALHFVRETLPAKFFADETISSRV